MTDTSSTAELTFTPVAEIPKVTRTGEGRAPIKWEDKLSPLKEKQGQAFMVWTYVKKTGATSRVAAVRQRLFTATPTDNWTVQVGPVPNSDEFGVFIRYNGIYTDEEVAGNAKARAERSERIKQANAAAKAADGAVQADNPPVAATPAEKVAAAKAANAKK